VTISIRNPVERRLDILADQWASFSADGKARVLRWLLSPDEVELLDVFLEVENSDGGEFPDLFVRVDAPFRDAARYGFVLRQALIDRYEEARREPNHELTLDWICPQPSPQLSATTALVDACVSLHRHHESRLTHVVLVMMPCDVAGSGRWCSWLEALVAEPLPAQVRVVVVDDWRQPRLDRLSVASRGTVVTAVPGLNVSSLVEDVANEVPGTGPDAVFRRHLAAMLGAASRGQFASATDSARAGLSIATQHGWGQMQLATLMAFGAVSLAAGSSEEARRCYQNAQALAAEQMEGMRKGLGGCACRPAWLKVRSVCRTHSSTLGHRVTYGPRKWRPLRKITCSPSKGGAWRPTATRPRGASTAAGPVARRRSKPDAG